MSGQVVLTGTIRCAPDEANALRDAVPQHVALTRDEPGCVSFDIHATADPCVYEVSERFRDDLAFEAHQTRTHASAWWGITRHMARDFAIIQE